MERSGQVNNRFTGRAQLKLSFCCPSRNCGVARSLMSWFTGLDRSPSV